MIYAYKNLIKLSCSNDRVDSSLLILKFYRRVIVTEIAKIINIFVDC